jgi:4-methyl-5(b-hydroxyethyl)-thiazole monophosphate biosynthesis
MFPMPPPTVLVILAEGFEEIEAVTSVDILRRAGAEVKIAALGEGIHVTGRCGVTLHADSTLESVAESRFDCLLLPGGPGVARLRNDPRVSGRVKRQLEENGWIAAICAAPLALKDVGILHGKRFTAHFSVSPELPDALLDERAVADGRLITSRGAGTAVDFALLLVERLFSVEKANEVAKSISA